MKPARKHGASGRFDIFELLRGSAVLERHLEQAELADVARDRRLRHLVALLFKKHRELFLGANRPRRDEREDRALTF